MAKGGKTGKDTGLFAETAVDPIGFLQSGEFRLRQKCEVFQTMKLVKRLSALLLAVCILLSTAFTATATEDEEDTQIKGSSGFDLMNVGTINPLSGSETAPYIAAADSPVLMSKENELLLYTSNKKALLRRMTS